MEKQINWKYKLGIGDLIGIIIVGLVIVFILLVILNTYVFGNKQFLDLNNKFDQAIFMLPNGECIEGSVESWKDYGDGDQIQVKVNGVTYLLHSSNIVLIGKE